VNFMIPALVGLIIQMQAVILTAFAIVREREKGTLEQLIVSPIKPWELMAGKILPYVLVSFVQVSVALLVGTLWFKVEITGSRLLIASSVISVWGERATAPITIITTASARSLPAARNAIAISFGATTSRY